MGLYCGIDLHSNNHVMTVIDEGDRRLYERRLPNDLAITKAALEPFRAQLVAVAVESTFNCFAQCFRFALQRRDVVPWVVQAFHSPLTLL